jgi:LysR family hydrogen peroxide-inducible transcriptional activator
LAPIDAGQVASMEMHSIKYCLAVYSERSFTRAARRCGVAQPSLSNGIRKLEQELGGPLFVRNVNGIALTLLGRAVRPHFEEIDRRIERIRKISSNLPNAEAARRKA